MDQLRARPEFIAITSRKRRGCAAIAVLAVLGSVLVTTSGGCGSAELNAERVVSDTPIPISSPTRADDAGTDANVSPPALAIGSPLCQQAYGACNPDLRSGCELVAAPTGDAGLRDGGSAASDGGKMLADGGVLPTGALACRTRSFGAPQCEPAGAGGDGAPCTSTTECGAGFACMTAVNSESNKSVGACRATCCNGKCESSTGVGAKAACLLGAVLNSTQQLPVCVAVRACRLLVSKDCADGETCAVVRNDGTTGCVSTGPQGVGDSCEFGNCARGSICLGEFGRRTCLLLCSEETLPCPDGRRCVWGEPLLPDRNAGVCVGSTM
jgi:hypothetical protein